MNLKKSLQNPFIFSLGFILIIILIHQIPLSSFFEFLNFMPDIALLLDKIVLNSIVIILAIILIKNNNLWKYAGLKIFKIKNAHFYLILLLYLYIFTGGFHSVEKIGIQNLMTGTIFLLLLKVVTVGILEEVVFRGLIQNKILNNFVSKKNGIIKAVFMAAFIFGFGHLLNLKFENVTLEGVFSQMYAAFCIGSLFGAILLRTKNIYPLIMVHAAINFFAGLDTYYPQYFSSELDPELSLAQIIFSIIFSLILFGSALLFSYFLLKPMNKKNNERNGYCLNSLKE